MALRLRLEREDRRVAPSPAKQSLRQVSFRKILRHDNPSFLMASFGATLFTFALFICISGTTPGGRGHRPRPVDPESAQGFLIFTGILMVSLCALAALRAIRIRRLFRSGDDVEATVETVSSAQGRSHLRLAYRHGGAHHSVRRSIRKSTRARALKPGEAFSILVDPTRPKRIVLAGLYD